MLLSVLLAQVYPLAIYFFSDALSSAAGDGMRASGDADQRGEISRVAHDRDRVLAAASVAVRWNGVLWWLMIAAALLRGYFPFSKNTSAHTSAHSLARYSGRGRG